MVAVTEGAFLQANTLVYYSGYTLVYPILLNPIGVAAGRVATTTLTFPEDARLDRAHISITASPGSTGGTDADLPSVAEIRPATALSSGMVAALLDFGGPVTVSRLTLVGFASVNSVWSWLGNQWRFLSSGTQFAETVTERLLVEANGRTQPELIAQLTDGTVGMPAQPTGLEVQVEGTTVWFERQGPTAGVTQPTVTSGVGYGFDRTLALQEALSRAVADLGVRHLAVTLRASTPGQLAVGISTDVVRQQAIAFPPDGLAYTVDATEEGPVPVPIQPPASAVDVREVSLVVRGSFGPQRVVPPAGPPIEDEATLVLATTRPALFGIPAALAGRLGELHGVRMPFTTTTDGAGIEIAGRLLADVAGRPGPVIAELTAAALTAGTSGWTTLTLATPLPIVLPPQPPGESSALAWWLELVPAYGEAEVALTTAPVTDPVAPGAPLLRRLPGGGTAPHTSVAALGELRAALRLVGVPGRDRPLPAIELSVPGSTVVAPVTPTGDDLQLVLTLPAPFVKPADGPVSLVATLYSAGSMTLSEVFVAYTETPSPGGAPA